MKSKMLRFRARGEALVPDFERLEVGVKSFVGRKFVSAGPDSWGFEPTGSASEVPYRAEYVKACKDGDLYPADMETAILCGVSFDPLFGEPAKSPPPKPLVKEKA